MREEILSPMERWLTKDTPKSTRDNYLSGWNDFMNWCATDRRVGEMTPESFLAKAKEGLVWVEDILNLYRNDLFERRLAEHTINKKIMIVRSFLTANNCSLPKQKRGRKPKASYEQRMKISQENVAEMVSAARSTRDKALICFLAQTGQRVGIISALRYKDVKTPLEGGKSPYAVTIPEKLLNYRGQNVNKGGTEYQFCFGEDAARLIRMMFDERRKKGEEITDNSWLFRSQENVSRTQYWTGGKMGEGEFAVKIKRLASELGKPLERRSVERIVNHAAKMVGIQNFVMTGLGKKVLALHPRTLRSYWKQQMRLGGVQDDELLNYMMGHVLPYEGAYDRFRKMVTEAYAKAEPYLSLTIRGQVDRVKQEAALEAIRRFAEIFGIDPMEVRIEKRKELGREPDASEEMEAIQNEIKRFSLRSSQP